MQSPSVNQDEQKVLQQLRFLLYSFGPMPTACFVRKVFSGLKWDDSFASELEKLQRLLQAYWKTDYLPPLIVTSSIETETTIEQDCLLVVVQNSHTKEIHMGVGRRFCVLGFDKCFPKETLCGGTQSFAVSFCPEFRLSKDSFLTITPSFASEVEHCYWPLHLASDEKKNPPSSSSSLSLASSSVIPDTRSPTSDEKPTQHKTAETDPPKTTTAKTAADEKSGPMSTEMDKKSIPQSATPPPPPPPAPLPVENKQTSANVPAKQQARARIDYGMPILMVHLLALLTVMYLFHVEHNEYVSRSFFLAVTTVQLFEMQYVCGELSILLALANYYRFFLICTHFLLSWNSYDLTHWLPILDTFISLEATCELVTNLVALLQSLYTVHRFRSLEDVCNYHRPKPSNRYRACLLVFLMLTLLLPCWFGAQGQENDYDTIHNVVVFALAQSAQLYFAEHLWAQAAHRHRFTSAFFSLGLLSVSIGCAVLFPDIGLICLYAAAFNIACTTVSFSALVLKF